MYIIKETKCYLLCSRHDNSYAAGPVLKLKQRSSPPNNLLRRVKTIWSIVYVSRRTLCYKYGYLPFDRKRLEPRVLSTQWHKGDHAYSLSTPFHNHTSPYFVLGVIRGAERGSFPIQDHLRSNLGTLRLRSNLIWGSFALGPGSFEDFKSLWIICGSVLFDCSF